MSAHNPIMVIPLEIDFVLLIVRMNILPKIQPMQVLYQQKDSVYKLVLLVGLTTTRGHVQLLPKGVRMVFLRIKLTINVCMQQNVQDLEIQFQETVFQHATATQMFIITEIFQQKCVS